MYTDKEETAYERVSVCVIRPHCRRDAFNRQTVSTRTQPHLYKILRVWKTVLIVSLYMYIPSHIRNSHCLMTGVSRQMEG
jgi:hypothetical protein